jgi:gamma-glutamyl phosphate reductase
MIEGVRAVRQLPDPSGRILERTILADGLTLEKITVPLGVLAVIFEARPDAITQIGALAIKSGNAVILKGGREVEHTMRAILDAMHFALALHGRVPADAVCGVYGREAVQALLGMNHLIDLVIPRGSNALVQHIQRNTLIPVLGHADGVCHIYIDQAADPAIDQPRRRRQQNPVSRRLQRGRNSSGPRGNRAHRSSVAGPRARREIR